MDIIGDTAGRLYRRNHSNTETKMDRWYTMIILAIVCFAVGSFLGKLASLKDIPHRVYFFEGVGTLTVFTTFVLTTAASSSTNFSFNAPALLMGSRGE